jgi:hypothetical protein
MTMGPARWSFGHSKFGGPNDLKTGHGWG